MSIHKSKGLEFPVVFLCNSNKQINLQDLKGDILFHGDIGIGPEYINYERKIEYSTAAKQAIKVRLKEENISEEMRILYVALTRAKEKLIITAVKKDEEKDLEKKKELIEVYIRNNKIHPILLKKCNSYIDWIEYVKLKNEILEGSNNFFDFNIYNAKDFCKEQETLDEENENVDFSEYNNFENIEAKLKWQYKDYLKTKLPIKSTVSTIKQAEGIGIEELTNKNIGLENYEPEFLSSEKISGSRLGTLTHLVLQKIDFYSIKTREDIEETIEKLKAKNFINEEEAKKINVGRILNFINSDLCKKIKQSKRFYKEKPFCMKINASRLLEEAKDEEILVQGIIDLFFENENGDLVLVDYKTDYIQEGEEYKLINRYKTQLELYKQALEQSLGKNVSETYIYSFALNKEIKI